MIGYKFENNIININTGTEIHVITGMKCIHTGSDIYVFSHIAGLFMPGKVVTNFLIITNKF